MFQPLRSKTATISTLPVFQTACAELTEQQQQEDFSGPLSIAPAYSYPQD